MTNMAQLWHYITYIDLVFDFIQSDLQVRNILSKDKCMRKTYRKCRTNMFPFEEQHKIQVETSIVQCLELQDTINVQVRAWKRMKENKKNLNVTQYEILSNISVCSKALRWPPAPY